MGQILLISPFRCRMWEGHDRLDEYITEESCREEIESFATRGQMIAVLGRRLCGDPDYDVELIYGARRLFAARHLNVPIRVDMCEIGNQEAIIALDTENRLRRDVSPYERALSYQRWLQAQYFKSQEELATALNMSASQVSRCLRLAKLPAVVVDAFPNPLQIRERWGIELHEGCQDPTRRRAITEKARALARESPRRDAVATYQTLSAGMSRPRQRLDDPGDEIVIGRNGEPLFRIRLQRGAVAVTISRATTGELFDRGAQGRIARPLATCNGSSNCHSTEIFTCSAFSKRSSDAGKRTPGRAVTGAPVALASR